MKQCPICHRSYADLSFRFCLEDGALLSKAFDPHGTLTLPEAPQLDSTIVIDSSRNESFIDDPVIAICINEQFPHCRNAEDVYTCTRCLWRLKKERAEAARYAFAVYKGEIKEVYEIEKWQAATKSFRDFWISKLRSQGRIINAAEHIGRYEFSGHLAPDRIRKKYLGRTIPRRHKGNPILYFNC
jgi:hypothetical protein